MSDLKSIKLGQLGDNSRSFSALDARTFVEGVQMTATCLVSKVGSGIDRNDSGFFTFYVKDVHANVYAARLFNAENFIENGFIAKSLENKPVKLIFIPQIFNGSWSLITECIENYSGEFDYESFRGRITTDAALIEFKHKTVFGNDVPPDYYTAAFNGICNGKCGGFMKLIESVAADLKNYTHVNGVNENDLYSIFFYTVKAYFAYLRKKEEFELVNQTYLLQVLMKIDAETEGHSMHSQIMDSCRAILGLGTPEHVLSHLIYNSFKHEENALWLIEKNYTLAKGMSVKLQNGTLINF